MPPELRKLFIRFIELGALLPHEDDFDPDDLQALAEHKLILREMAKVQDEIKRFTHVGKPPVRGNVLKDEVPI